VWGIVTLASRGDDSSRELPDRLQIQTLLSDRSHAGARRRCACVTAMSPMDFMSYLTGSSAASRGCGLLCSFGGVSASGSMPDAQCMDDSTAQLLAVSESWTMYSVRVLDNVHHAKTIKDQWLHISLSCRGETSKSLGSRPRPLS
jgi:hypothetical protein